MLDQFLLQPSRTLAILLSGMHFLAVCAVWLLNVVFWARFALVLLILVSLIYCLFHYALLRTASSWRSFSLSQRHIEIDTMGGKRLSGEIASGTVVIPACVVLRVSLDGHALPVAQLVFRDSMSSEDFRALRVRLRFS